jgi:hypothetical protein
MYSHAGLWVAGWTMQQQTAPHALHAKFVTTLILSALTLNQVPCGTAPARG